jgi:hypothetical protein
MGQSVAEMNGATIAFAYKSRVGTFERAFRVEDRYEAGTYDRPGRMLTKAVTRRYAVEVELELWRGGRERRTPTMERAADDRLSLHGLVLTRRIDARLRDDLEGWDHGGPESTLLAVRAFEAGWSRRIAEMLARLLEAWHGHDMRSLCVHQVALGWTAWCVGHPGSDRPLDAEDAARAMKAARATGVALAEHGPGKYPPVIEETVIAERRPDGSMSTLFGVKRHYWYEPGSSLATYCPNRLSMPCPECGYRCGSEWLHEPLPDEAVAFVRTLPGASVGPDADA